MLSAGWARGPEILVPQDVPPEVSELVESTWDSFVDVFAGRDECIGTVGLVLVRSVDGGDAVYSPGDRMIRIEIPTTPVRFPESLAHELGHHVEHACSVPEDIGPEFRRAQGLSAGISWSGAAPWNGSPSEHFAETVVALVNGRRVLHADVLTVTPEAEDLVAAWGSAQP
jgi:hypothetical protein